MSTKYHEQNVHGQGRNQNRFQSGNQFQYGIEIDKRYGKGTGEKLLALSRQTCKRSKFEFDIMTEHYGKEAVRIANEKGIDISKVTILKRWNK